MLENTVTPTWRSKISSEINAKNIKQAKARNNAFNPILDSLIE